MPTSGRAGTEQSEGEAGRGAPEQAGTRDELAVVPEQAAVQMAPMSTEEAAERCELLCALCTKSPQLLRMLLEVFGKVQHRSPDPRQLPSYMASRARVLAQCCQNSPVCCTCGSTRAGSSHSSRRKCHLTLCVKPEVPEELSVERLLLLKSTNSINLPPPLLFDAFLLERCICYLRGAKSCHARYLYQYLELGKQHQRLVSWQRRPVDLGCCLQ